MLRYSINVNPREARLGDPRSEYSYHVFPRDLSHHLKQILRGSILVQKLLHVDFEAVLVHLLISDEVNNHPAKCTAFIVRNPIEYGV